MTATKKNLEGKGYFVSTKNSYVRFEGNGMSVDMEKFLKTKEGLERFRELTNSAFAQKKAASRLVRAKK
ncbi:MULTISPECIES: hypothetical protein [Rhodanobacteraceae]|uniref:hypothetical protein n=1 Tax=Rhodanobacteraceae TaxID=1775411 RepID=UPI00087FCB95|nr:MULTISPECIES: hypothetical protein [Rhodanobacteraceae]MDR6641855.1 hypothetical protein [Luteibacter sp. 1214]SDG00579.1 hypothetical protein SAMN04515659_1868 [Dyella sp. 333MFSha]SKB31208.1 hypothetical protein SAMN05660880_00511 [Luteibacter sp. 22Crub2.1]